MLGASNLKYILNLLLVTFKALHGLAPCYISILLVPEPFLILFVFIEVQLKIISPQEDMGHIPKILSNVCIIHKTLRSKKYKDHHLVDLVGHT